MMEGELIDEDDDLTEDADICRPRAPPKPVARGNDTRVGRHSCVCPPTGRSTPTYSMCGARLRWINTAQLLGFIRSLDFTNALLHAARARENTTKANAGETDSWQQCNHRNRTEQTANHISFLSVVDFPVSVHSSPPLRASGCETVLRDTLHDTASEGPRFTSYLKMPVPESFRSVWSTEHIPSLHISARPEKLKKLLNEKEIRRDDNHNIEEVSESEVPLSRIYATERNGNGVHLENEQLPQRSLPTNIEYSESVSLVRVPAHQEYRYGVHCEIDNSRRYRDEVRLVPGQTNPGRYYSTMTQCFINSKYRRYRETVFIRLNAPSPKQYSTSVFVFPRSVRETHVSGVEHTAEETIKWYKVGVNMEARDYVSVKFVQIE
ncbi:uncharacterized protein [Diadema antillarum]|uniref:uncharacterized protein n=1 Tax=Diadema antillarum TaxID=105358 RepID=UPI003A83BD0A